MGAPVDISRPATLGIEMLNWRYHSWRVISYLLGWWGSCSLVSSQPQCLLQTLKSCHVRPHSPKIFSQCSSELYLGEGGYFDRRRNLVLGIALNGGSVFDLIVLAWSSLAAGLGPLLILRIRSLGGWTFGPRDDGRGHRNRDGMAVWLGTDGGGVRCVSCYGDGLSDLHHR